MLNPLITIVTVVFNDVFGIENTIKSVLNQTYKKIEYIIIDGGSTDGTVEIINRYCDRISLFISEADNGIYDAMNKGILHSNGSWINFMNSGDFFYSSTVLDDIFSRGVDFNSNTVVYGYKFSQGKFYFPYSIDVVYSGIIMGNHQSMFFNVNLCGKSFLMYNTFYRIYSDFDLILRICKKFGNNSLVFKNICVVNYLGGGISSKVSFQKRKEKFQIILFELGVLGLFRALRFKMNISI